MYFSPYMCPSVMGPVEDVHSSVLQPDCSGHLALTKQMCTTKSKYNNTLHFKYQIVLGGKTAVIASLTNIMGTDLKLQHSPEPTTEEFAATSTEVYTHKPFHEDHSLSYIKFHPPMRSSSLDSSSVCGRSQIRIPAQSCQGIVEPFRPYDVSPKY